LSQSIADSLNVEYCRQPGVSLIRKLKYYVLPKCHALLLDSRLNTAETIAVNTYQVHHDFSVAVAKSNSSTLLISDFLVRRYQIIGSSQCTRAQS
jgi:hypothetical protein